MRRPPVLSVLPVLAVLAVLAAAPLSAQVPVGHEIHVNQNQAPGKQVRPDVGVAADGSFVVVWEAKGGGHVWVRRYRASGKPHGSEFRASRLGNGHQAAPAVAVRPDGSFVVVWNRIAAGGTRVDLYASRFTAGGQAIGEPRLVGSAAQASAFEPAAVTLLPDGGFFVAWTLEDGLVGDTPSRDLYGRRRGPLPRVDLPGQHDRDLPGISAGGGHGRGLRRHLDGPHPNPPARGERRRHGRGHRAAGQRALRRQ
ncbi:MAG TPA: hypothetical protein VNM67_03055 [Thermoanaerobaculia bacterium]|nr:hypothetical protein [Thermoanaerobaculia bacterium]